LKYFIPTFIIVADSVRRD